MKFIIHAPIDNLSPEFQSGAGVREVAIALERAGLYGAFVTEHPAPPAKWLHEDPVGHDALDPFASLAFMAAATTRLKVVSSAVVLPFRNPFLTAKAAATLQILSDNRFIMGVGIGYLKEEFDALGVAYDKRGAVTEDSLETIRMAWKGGPVVRQGIGFNAIGNEPRPVPTPPPPIWVGGGIDKALERAAKWGDGWMPHFSSPSPDPIVQKSLIGSFERFSEMVDRLMNIRAKMGKTNPFDISVGSPFHPQAITRTDADKFLEVTHKLVACGATSVWTLVPGASLAGYLESVAWFGEEIIRLFNQLNHPEGRPLRERVRDAITH